jgi:hypothetical protein
MADKLQPSMSLTFVAFVLCDIIVNANFPHVSTLTLTMARWER